MIECSCGPEYVQSFVFAPGVSIGHSKRGSCQRNQFLRSRTHTSDSEELLGSKKTSRSFSGSSQRTGGNHPGNGSILGLLSMCSLCRLGSCALGGEAKIRG